MSKIETIAKSEFRGSDLKRNLLVAKKNNSNSDYDYGKPTWGKKAYVVYTV